MNIAGYLFAGSLTRFWKDATRRTQSSWSVREVERSLTQLPTTKRPLPFPCILSCQRVLRLS